MPSYPFITAVVLVHNLAFAITQYFKTKDLYRYNIIIYCDWRQAPHSATAIRKYNCYGQCKNNCWQEQTVQQRGKCNEYGTSLQFLQSQHTIFPNHYTYEQVTSHFWRGASAILQEKLPGGHSTKWFVYTYLTMKFAYWYYTHSELLIGVDCLLTLAASLKINLSVVLPCSSKVWYAVLWVYLTTTAKYPSCSFCPHSTDCTLT